MQRRIITLLVFALLLAGCGPYRAWTAEHLIAAQPSEPDVPKAPASCPVTQPQDPVFVPPAPYAPVGPYHEFWYGTNDLWVLLQPDGVWYGLPHTHAGYTQKLLWWREGYEPLTEEQPLLTVTGRRLDGDAPPLVTSRATNGWQQDVGPFMLVGVEIPTLGCWEITGHYYGHDLSYVVWVAQ
jgi:hypothetical protein